MKRIIKISFFSLVVLLFASCNNSGTKSDNNLKDLIEGKGGRYYGGVLRLNETESFKTLFPPSIIDAVSYRLANQVYEGLYKFDQQTLEVKKSLVEEEILDSTGKVYTFKLKKGVFFHDDACFDGGKGRELKAQDVKYCFTKLCTQDVNNQGFIVFKDVVKGANAYFAATSGGKTPDFELEGVKVIDDYTVQVELVEPNALFRFQLARPISFIYPKEAFDKYGLGMRTKAVGTGPFKIQSIDEEQIVTLIRNEKYYGVDQYGNKLPFLQGVEITFRKDKKAELHEFKKGNLDMIYRLPTEYIIQILEETGPQKTGEYSQFELQRKPEMATQFLVFKNSGKVFNNKYLRKAFSFAIDRKQILEYVLEGEGYMEGFYGITPPSFEDYDVKNVTKGYRLDKDSALYYLEKAGYKGGKGLPKIELYINSEGERNHHVAMEVQKHIEQNLGIKIYIEVVSLSVLIDKMIGGQADFMRTGYQADYPSPENFLSLFYGKDVPKESDAKSYPNFARYVNPEFDRLYDLAMHANTVEEANKYFMMAENVLMDDAPIIVLWYDEAYRLLQPYVKNFHNNPMQVRDYSEVYLSKTKPVVPQ